MVRSLGIVGYGSVGKYLLQKIQETGDFTIAFVWNRSVDKLKNDESIKPEWILENLDDFASRGADVIVEVAHPDITATYGAQFIKAADYFIGSPTALANKSTEEKCLAAANEEKSTPRGLYVPAGALWGSLDIRKMADLGSLGKLKVTMKKHPSSLKLVGEDINRKLQSAYDTKAPVVLYDGPVRDLCPQAPNNVNTMAAAAVAAHNLGFDGVYGCIVADVNLEHCHLVEIEAEGHPKPDGSAPFSVKTVRYNPAAVGAVTGSATYASFWSSLKRVGTNQNGAYLC